MQKAIKDMWKNAVEKMPDVRDTAQSQNGVRNSHHYSKTKKHDIPAIIMVFLIISLSSFIGCLAAGIVIIWIM